jgi:hypothetical protein
VAVDRSVLVACPILVDPDEPTDVATVNTLQDQLRVTAGSARQFAMPDCDQAGLDATRAALLQLGKGLHGFERSFGAKGEVNPVRHLIATASGWGGLPGNEATYPRRQPRPTTRGVPAHGA